MRSRGVPGARRQVLRGGRVARAAVLLATILAVGIVGYTILGLSLLDATYQTVTTISTVGFSEAWESNDAAFEVFTILLILGGVGAVFYTLGVLFEFLVEGRLTDHLWRRRMDRTIAAMSDHVIVCGWGRVGQTLCRDLVAQGQPVVVIDQDEDRLRGLDLPHIVGDATDDDVLAAASIGRARALVAALNADAPNLYVTLSGRSARPDLFIVARARVESAEAKLVQAGADRVINPQHIGGQRIAAMIMQPIVADFLDVVMHDQALEFRLAEIEVDPASPVVGRTLRESQLRDTTGALVLAMRDGAGQFRTNPEPDSIIRPGEVLIAVGTEAQLKELGAVLGAR